MAVNEVCGKTRNNAKNVIFKAIQKFFTNGFTKWEADGKKLFYGEKFAPIKKGTQSFSRRLFYLFEVTDAFEAFIGRLKKAEEWLDNPDIEQVVYSRSLYNRERLENSYRKLIGEEPPILGDIIDVAAFAGEDGIGQADSPVDGGEAA